MDFDLIYQTYFKDVFLFLRSISDNESIAEEMTQETFVKALKAVFVTRMLGEELPYIHKLMRLANLSGISAEMTEEQLSLLDILSPLNVEARYPLHRERLLASLTPKRCQQLIDETEALLTWIKTKC